MKNLLITAFLVLSSPHYVSSQQTYTVEQKPTESISRTATNDAWKKILPSAVLIYTLDSDGNHNGHGSGICIATGQSEFGNLYVILTAKHMLEEKSPPLVSLMNLFGVKTEPAKHSIEVFTYDKRGKQVSKKEIKEKDSFFMKILYDDDDLGLVFVMTCEKLDLVAADLLPEEEADNFEIGDNVYMASCPWVNRVLFKTGTISGISDSIVDIDGGIYFGSSGGGVFNAEYKLIAVTFAMASQTNNVAIPISKVYDFFRENNILLSKMEKG